MSYVFPSWNWSSNNQVCKRGTRIIISWDPGIVQLMILNVTDQVIHCFAKSVDNEWQMFVSFIYADNGYIRRRVLWADLQKHYSYVGNEPWVIMGDFNVSLYVDESTAGTSSSTVAIRDFQECIDHICMSDINRSGFQFTWNQKPRANSGILKKIDRVMGNDKFMDKFNAAYAVFYPYRISDHCPVMRMESSCSGAMFILVKRLRLFKRHVRRLMWSKGDIYKQVAACREKLDEAQRSLDADSFATDKRELAAVLLKEYNEAQHMVRKVTDKEIKDAIFDIGESKSPGPDGYSSVFFKEAWDVIGVDVIRAVKEFFCTGQMLRDINNTTIALLPKGDPMSSYLFTLVMEVLTLMIKRNISESGSFRFHPKCDQLRIVNLCFADDLFIFAYACTSSILVIRDSLEEFKRCSGLVPSLPKSTAFFCNVSTGMKNQILMLMTFEEGKLPVKYLGVPLVSSRLMYRDCKVLVDRVKSKVNHWMNKFLSFAGRVQLITSVLTLMQIYWCSVFILPDQVIKDIEKLIRGFLWCQGPMIRGKAKVKWDDVCLPKEEGGLGIKRLKNWDTALMWVNWTHEYKLKARHLWDVVLKSDAAWSWRKILNIWPLLRNYIVCQVGDGKLVSVWFDAWDPIGPLANIISTRDICRAGWNSKTVICDIISGSGFAWPSDWLDKYPLISTINVPILSTIPDTYGWKRDNDVVFGFSVKNAWESFRPRSAKVP
ncbi:uncharacterized protein [Rutidosis leptorrhynchoides]|uniref:uncharacterized protein n=1 Tax=Rutidosis leptorrhynchoides TaxID=125765 RepID=UPI003A995BC2